MEFLDLCYVVFHYHAQIQLFRTNLSPVFVKAEYHYFMKLLN